jgi:hypothetical protein
MQLSVITPRVNEKDDMDALLEEVIEVLPSFNRWHPGADPAFRGACGFQDHLGWRSSRGGRSLVEPDNRRCGLLSWIFKVVPMVVFVLFSIRHQVEANWGGPVFLVALPGIAQQIIQTRCTSFK